MILDGRLLDRRASPSMLVTPSLGVLGVVLEPRWLILEYGILLLIAAFSEFLIQKEGNMLNIVLDAAGWVGLVCFPLHFFYPWVAIGCTLAGTLPVTVLFANMFKRRRDVSSLLVIVVTLFVAFTLCAALAHGIQETGPASLGLASSPQDILDEARV